MRKRIAGLMAAGLSLASGMAAANDTQVLEAATPWSVTNPGNTCRVVREFGAESDRIQLTFVRFYPGTDLQLILKGPGLNLPRRTEWITLQYGPNRRQRREAVARSEDGGEVSWFVLDASILPPRAPSPAELAPLPTEADELLVARTVDSLVLGQASFRGVELKLGQMDEPLRKMNECVDGLLVSWGIEPTRQKAVRRAVAPLTDSRTWVTYADYPNTTVRRGRWYGVYAIVTIDAQGAVTGCRTGDSSEGPFAQAVCNAIRQRARFSPALDSEGRPMPSFWANGIYIQRP